MGEDSNYGTDIVVELNNYRVWTIFHPYMLEKKIQII